MANDFGGYILGAQRALVKAASVVSQRCQRLTEVKEPIIGRKGLSRPLQNGPFPPGRDAQSFRVDTESREYIVGCMDGALGLAREIARECLGMYSEQMVLRPRDVILLLKDSLRPAMRNTGGRWEGGR